MDNIDTVQTFRLATLVLWVVVVWTTVPFLLVASRGHRRSNLLTIALLALLGMLMASLSYDSARTAPQMDRPVRLWIDYYGATGLSALMAGVLGVRTWLIMFGRG